MALQLRLALEKVEIKLAKVEHVDVVELGRERRKVPGFDLKLSQLNPVHVLDLCALFMLPACTLRKEERGKERKKQ